jgi:hypothetical protein
MVAKVQVRRLQVSPEGVIALDPFTRPSILISDLVKRSLARRWAP